MLELIVSFVFEYLSYRIGVALIAFITMGKVRPHSKSNPFYFSVVGFVFIIIIVGVVVYLFNK